MLGGRAAAWVGGSSSRIGKATQQPRRAERRWLTSLVETGEKERNPEYYGNLPNDLPDILCADVKLMLNEVLFILRRCLPSFLRYGESSLGGAVIRPVR